MAMSWGIAITPHFLGKPISGLPTLAAGNMDVADGGAAARCALEMTGINFMRGAQEWTNQRSKNENLTIDHRDFKG